MDKYPDEAIKREPPKTRTTARTTERTADEDFTRYAWVSRKVLQHSPTGGNEIPSRDIFKPPAPQGVYSIGTTNLVP